MVAAGTSIAMQEGPLQVEALAEALEALEKSPQGKKLSKDVEKKIQDIVAYINEAYVDKFLKSGQEKPLETLLPSKTWGSLPKDIQLVIANQLIKDAVDYINRLMIPHTTIKADPVDPSKILFVEFNHDGSRVVSAAAGEKSIIWNTDDGQLIHAFSAYSQIISVGFNHDGSRIVSGSGDGMILLWKIDIGKYRFIAYHDSNTVFSVAFGPDGSRVASGADDGTIKIWNVDNNQLIHTFPHGSQVNSVDFNHDGSKVASGGSDGMVKIWNADNGEWIHTLQHGNFVHSAVFNHDGSKVVSASFDGTVKMWSTDDGRLIHTFPHGSLPVNSAVFNHDGSMVVSGAGDGMIKLWDVDNGHLIHTFPHGSPVNSVDFNHDGSMVVSGADDGTIKIWDQRKEKVFKWFTSVDFHLDQAVIIKRAYEAKLRGKKLALKGDGLVTFNKMPNYVKSLLIDYLDIIFPESKSKSD